MESIKKTFILLAILGGGAGVFTANAQRDSRSHENNVISIAVNDSSADSSKVEAAFKANAPVSPKDNGLPRFAIVGKDRSFYLGIGGQFLGEGVFDWGGTMSSPVLMTPSAITPSSPGNGGSLDFAWQTSSVYMNLVAMPHTDNQLGVFFKANFMGNNNAFNCFHFYAKYRGLTAGYTNSLFTDGAAEPFTIDFEGPNGYPFVTLFTAYWQQPLGDNFSIAGGIDAPTASFSTGKTTESVSQRLPAVPFYVQYAWGGGASHVRLSGIVRPMQYRNLNDNKNSTLVGHGIQLSGMTGIAGGLSLQLNAAYGSGIASYIQDDNGLGLDAVATSTPGKMKMVRTLGITGGISYTFSPKVTSNIVYSHASNFFGGTSDVSATQYRYGDYLAANVVYAVNKFISVGMEYDYGHRKSIDGTSLHTNRLQCQLAVTF